VCSNLGYNSSIKAECSENMFTATVHIILKHQDSSGKRKKKKEKKVESQTKPKDSK